MFAGGLQALEGNQYACGAGIYSDSIPETAMTYKSHNWKQYAFWAAAWLHTLTKEPGYKIVRTHAAN